MSGRGGNSIRSETINLPQKIWRGEYWGDDGVLRYVEDDIQRFYDGDEEVPARKLSRFSSIFYSAAGNAMANFKKEPWKIWWAWRVLRCLHRAVRFSDRLHREVGLEGMTPDQLDVRQSVMRKARRYTDALSCIEEALGRPGELEPHTQALLHVGRAQIMLAGPKRFVNEAKGKESMVAARKLVERFAEGDPAQASRVLRGYAELLVIIHERFGTPLDSALLRSTRRRAQGLAERAGATDQLLKMKQEQ